MKTLGLFFVLTITIIGSRTSACDCDTVHSFITMYHRLYKPVDLITIVKLEDYYYGMKVKVIDKNGNAYLNDTITIWGDNGALCRIGSGLDYIKNSDTLFYLLTKTDLSGNIIRNNDYPDSLEKATDFMLGNCGNTFAFIKSDSVFMTNYENLRVSKVRFFQLLEDSISNSINNNRTTNSFEIFPNPLKGSVVYLKTESQNTSMLKVFDSAGRLLDEKVFKHVLNYNVREKLETGMYIFQIKTQNLISSSKLLIQ